MAEKYPCFLYREGVHFSLSDAMLPLRKNLVDFVSPGPSGEPVPDSSLFFPVNTPEEARFFLFPYDIGPFTDSGLVEDVSRIICSLPFIHGREKRHLVTDFADRPECPDPNVCLFKASLMRRDADKGVCTWYNLSESMRTRKPDFSWEGIRYDVSFVGRVTSELRRAAIAALRHETSELRLFISMDDGFHSDGIAFYTVDADPEEQARRQAVFLTSLQRSFCIFCPPGVGLSSLRLFEAMAQGRIPVFFDFGAVLPLEDSVAYKGFSLVIPASELPRTGEIVTSWLRAQSPHELRERCVLAAKTWQTRFARDKNRTLLNEAIRRFSI